jgi:hypothetical protein
MLKINFVTKKWFNMLEINILDHFQVIPSKVVSVDVKQM